MGEEVPTEPKLQPQVLQPPEDGELRAIDDGNSLETPPLESRILDSGDEVVDNESRVGTTTASETVADEITQASESEPTPPLERVVERRPSLESVWESLQEKGSLSSSASEPELQKVVPEMEVPRVRPSSLRTRPRTGAKRNVTFKDDFEKKEEIEVRKRQVADRRTKVPPGCLGLFLSVALASLIVYIASPNVPTKPRLWTSAELEKYNGTNNKPPLLLSILGSVFDVSKGWKHYGPGGSYHHFVGRDASRAFVSGNFTDDGLTDSLDGLTPSQIKAIDDWRLFFVNRYVYLGKLVGTFYNKDGLPTKMFYLTEKKIKLASNSQKEQKLDEERFPNCNSRWTQNEGGEVWCNDGLLPRIVELVTDGPSRGPPPTRCACLEQDELQRPGLKGYGGCDAQSSKCKT